MLKTKLRRVGNSFSVTLPKSIVEDLHLVEGEDLNIIQTTEGILMSPYDVEFNDWIKAYEKSNSKFRYALKKLTV
ncbi:AbrB/MazE/SpoVT family DNA-binding domain-containing protein [bacterium]|nr:AbrB/MazE/SpoVT family DNA-binding domain-containing protein [bacterium]MCI0605965.1 AbrB/MazE/SpoVT family DNA-binding domain-containing protein [bacterium]